MSIILSMMVKVSIHHASFSIFHSFSVTLNKYFKKTTFMSLYCYCDPSKKWWKTKEIQHFVWRNFINKHRSTFRLCISLTKLRNRVFRSQTYKTRSGKREEFVLKTRRTRRWKWAIVSIIYLYTCVLANDPQNSKLKKIYFLWFQF